ncbi:AfsR family transcriptional regulator, partial [Streptomyces sp. DT225]
LRTLHQQILTGSPAASAGVFRPNAVQPAGTGAPEPEPPAPRLVLSETPKPAQLPPVARGFLGRSRELERLARLLTETEPRGASTPIVVV